MYLVTEILVMNSCFSLLDAWCKVGMRCYLLYVDSFRPLRLLSGILRWTRYTTSFYNFLMCPTRCNECGIDDGMLVNLR